MNILNKRTYIEHETKITAENLNEIQDCVIEVQNAVNKLDNKLLGMEWTEDERTRFKQFLVDTLGSTQPVEPEYALGDCYPNLDGTWYMCEGSITANKKEVFFNANVDKSLKNIPVENISFVSAENGGMRIYSTAGSLLSNYVKPEYISNSSPIEAFRIYKITDRKLMARVTFKTAFTQSVGYTPALVQLLGNFVFS